MAKKNFDDFVDSVEKPKRPSLEDAARMVSLVHREAAAAPEPRIVAVAEPVAAKEAEALQNDAPKKVPSPKPPAAKPKQEPAASKRGRPRTERNETERLYRLSVDLPGSVLLKLKGAAMESDTDMKTYVRNLLEKHLERR